MATPTAHTVTTSAGRFTAALVVQRLLSFGYFTFAAAAVGPSVLGSYVVALNLAMTLGGLADLGLANVLTREISKHPERSRSLFSLTLTVKLGMIVVAYGALHLVAAATPTAPETYQLLWGTGLAMALDAITLSAYAVLRGQGRLHLEGWGSIIAQLAVLACGVPLLLAAPTATNLVIALLAGSVVNVAYSLRLLYRSGITLSLRSFSGAEARWLWLVAWPFAASLIFTRLYGYADSIIISWLRDTVAVGYYGVPAKLMTSLQFIPLAFVAALYPALAAVHARRDQVMLQSLLHESVRYMWIVGIAAAALLISVARPLLLTLYGSAYEPSIVVLQVLLVQVPLLFISFPLGSLLNACDRQRSTTLAVAVAVVTDIILLVLLFPAFGLLGAAAASVASTAVMVAVQVWRSRGLVGKPSGLQLSQLLLAGLVGLLTIIVTLGLHPATLVGSFMLAGALFFGLGAASGVLKRQDLARLRAIVSRV